MVSHDYLVARARTWLRSQKYPLVLSGMASCDEIPDAIGFATSRSAVVEVKTSKSDFHRDRTKYKYLIHEDGGRCSLKASAAFRKRFEGCRVVLSPNMGNQRYFLSEPDIISMEMVIEHHPDHGLLHLHGRIVKKVLAAPMRKPDLHNLAAEVKYLQYSMRHLLGNLGKAGVRVDIIEAVKMFGHHTAVDIAEWKKKNLQYESAVEVAHG